MDSNDQIECDDKKTSDGDDNFVWQDYLEVTNSVEVPQMLFSHVEQSLLSGLQEGMLLEVPHKQNPNTYWLTSIIMACGPLLRLRYVGQEEDRTQDFWCDVTKVSVHPLGWCKEHGMQLEPPLELQYKLDDHWAVIARAMQNAKGVPPQLLTGDGFTPVDRIKQGMKVEVQDKQDPKRLWVATIIENVGGRLLLRYDTPDSSSPDFWLFYSSPRLFRMGWVAQKGPPWILHWPSYMKTHHGPEEWAAVMEMAKEDARRVPLPPDLFLNNMCVPTLHQFAVGMKLEAVHPHNMVEVCPASIVKVFDQFNFLIQIDSHGSRETDAIESTWLCSSQQPYIFPVGWAQDKGLQLTHPRGWTTANEEFDWAEYLTVSKTHPAPRSFFGTHTSAKELGFQCGMKLEAVNPENQHQICASSITKMIDHLIWINLDSNDSFHPCHIVSTDSLDIFPVGWCESNSYPLKPPKFYQSPVKPEPQNLDTGERKDNCNSAVQQRSFWCPKIYFNHKCFSGPFLSKGKLAQLPKAVGPGPVTLVMREVLAMLISVAYKSSRVLKELQSDGKPEPGMHLEVLKAKYKTNTYRASVAVVTSADQVPTFCKAICERLQVCHYMFGPVAVGENSCPEGCNSLSKTRFTQYWVQGKRKIGRPKGEASNLVPRPKKKRGRKRLIGSQKVENENGENENVADVSEEPASQENVSSVIEPAGQESNTSILEPAAQESNVSVLEPAGQEGIVSGPEGNESDTNSFSGLRRKYSKKEFPPTVMKTRGAKLPNFALQMRAGHWPQKKWSSSSSDSSKHNDRNQNSSHYSTQSKKPIGVERQIEFCNTFKSETVDKEFLRVHCPIQDTLTSLTKHQIELHSNPLYWSEDDVYQYLMKTEDCAWVAQRCKDEMIDGQAFMMLNLPTLQEHLYLKMGPALKLCHHIEQVKLAFYLQYISGS